MRRITNYIAMAALIVGCGRSNNGPVAPPLTAAPKKTVVDVNSGNDVHVNELIEISGNLDFAEGAPPPPSVVVKIKSPKGLIMGSATPKVDVAEGGKGTFHCQLKAPRTPGEYQVFTGLGKQEFSSTPLKVQPE